MNIIELSKKWVHVKGLQKHSLVSQMEMSLSRCKQNGRGAY